MQFNIFSFGCGSLLLQFLHESKIFVISNNDIIILISKFSLFISDNYSFIIYSII